MKQLTYRSSRNGEYTLARPDMRCYVEVVHQDSRAAAPCRGLGWSALFSYTQKNLVDQWVVVDDVFALLPSC